MKKDKLNNEVEEPLQDGLFRKEMDRRAFLEGTTKIAGAAFGVTLLGSLTSLPVKAASISSVMHSNGRKPDLMFPVISDVHIQHQSDDFLNKLITTLDQLNEVAPNQDAFVVNGDLTDLGLVSEYDKFMSAYNVRKQPQAISMFAIGNHDYWNGLSAADAQKRFLEKTGMESMYYHKVIKGYHFIILYTEDGNTPGTFSEKQIQWLDEQLKIANDDNWKKDDNSQGDDNWIKPIFVFHHQPIKGTIYGSEWGFDQDRDLFYNTLAKYPQVISFSGHTHYPLDDPKIIMQKDFTAIGTSTGAYMWLDSGRIQGEIPEGASILNQALIVEVYNNKKVIIKRRDIHNNGWTGEPFVIENPGNKKEFTYTADRDKKEPFFTNNAMLSIVKEKTTATSIAIMFTQAKDNLLVHDYKVVTRNVETNEVAKEFLAFSEFYKDPVPNPLTLQINGLMPKTTYEIEVHALDAFGNVSNNSLKVLYITDSVILNSITAPAAIKGVDNGTAKTAADLKLPQTVKLVTNDGNIDAGVTWNVDASSYDPSLKTEQTFTITGTVTLPKGVKNPNNIPLTTSISVTVDGVVAVFVKAANYTSANNVQKENTSDIGGGQHVGYLAPGSWMEYSGIDIPSTGTYTLQYRVAVNNTGAAISFVVDGVPQKTTSLPYSGGWSSWTTVYDKVTLAAGKHTIRLAVPMNGYNINWFKLSE